MRSRFAFLFFIVAAAMPFVSVRAAEEAGFATGFVERDIWFSEEKLDEGDAVRIYTAVFNDNDASLSGTVAFYDSETLLGKKDFSIAAKNVGTVSIVWNVTAGTHAIRAEITDSAITIAGAKQPIFIEDGESDEAAFSVAKRILVDTDTEESNDKTPNAAAAFIEEHVPAVIATPVLATTAAIDGWRDTAAEVLEKKKEDQQEVIDALKDEPMLEAKVALTDKGDVTVAPDENKLKKPLEHVKLFFLTIGEYIFSHKTLFYAMTGVLAFLIIRFAWRRIL